MIDLLSKYIIQATRKLHACTSISVLRPMPDVAVQQQMVKSLGKLSNDSPGNAW